MHWILLCQDYGSPYASLISSPDSFIVLEPAIVLVLLSFLVNQSLPLIAISLKNDLHEFLPPCILTCRGPYAFINRFLRECSSYQIWLTKG